MTTTALLPVASLWVGERLSTLERLSMASFVACGHAYELYAYRDYPDLPDGVQLRDANAILPEREIYYCSGYKHTQSAPALKVTPFANWFRWELLSRRRCWWADTDIICLKALDLEGELVAGAQTTGSRTDVTEMMVADYRKWTETFTGRHVGLSVTVNNALVMCADPKNPVVLSLRRVCRDPWLMVVCTRLLPQRGLGHDIARTRSVTTLVARMFQGLTRVRRSYASSFLAGPVPFTEMILKYKAWSDIKDRSFFYPVFWRDWRTLFDDTYADQHDPFPRAYTVHLWNDMLRRDNVDKDQSFAPRSFVERMKRRYLS